MAKTAEQKLEIYRSKWRQSIQAETELIGRETKMIDVLAQSELSDKEKLRLITRVLTSVKDCDY